MTRDEIEKMVKGYEGWDRCIVLFPVGEQTGCRWIGMSIGQTAQTLSTCAAEIITKHMAPVDGKTH